MEDSHWPKLVLITSARLLLTMYWADRSTPSVVLVDLEATNLTVAPGAVPPDHSASRSASPSSAAPRSPGFVPFTMIVGVLTGRPRVLRKVAQLAVPGLVRPTMPMTAPVPVPLLE